MYEATSAWYGSSSTRRSNGGAAGDRNMEFEDIAREATSPRWRNPRRSPRIAYRDAAPLQHAEPLGRGVPARPPGQGRPLHVRPHGLRPRAHRQPQDVRLGGRDLSLIHISEPTRPY